MNQPYDAILFLSFGGPEGMDEVMPFLENVLRGKNVPAERMKVVAQHYESFGGISPINNLNRDLIARLKTVLEKEGPNLPIYWGNRNWHPLLKDTLAQMKDDGIKRAICFVTSAYSSYSGCRQYLEDIARAQEQVGPGAPCVDKLRVYCNHPKFIEACVANLQTTLSEFTKEEQAQLRLAFTAHSIPKSMAQGCAYESQLEMVSNLVAQACGIDKERTKVVYQSRSGPPSVPWLEPDICDYIRELHAQGVRSLVIDPIGFVSDHMEVIYDLDTQAAEVCRELGVKMKRVPSAGCHPLFIEMIRELILERINENNPQREGTLLKAQGVCRDDCCPSGMVPRSAS